MDTAGKVAIVAVIIVAAILCYGFRGNESVLENDCYLLDNISECTKCCDTIDNRFGFQRYYPKECNDLCIENMPDLGSYDYCVQWGGFIDRMQILYECGVQIKPPLSCDFDILDDNELEITIYDHSKNISEMVIEQKYYNCTQLVKSIRR